MNKGFSILLTIIVIVLFSGLGLIGLSMLITETQMSIDTTTSAQAFYIAEGGMQYYLEQLQNDSSWATPPDKPNGKSLGKGTFTITTDNEEDDSIDVISTANVTGMDGGTIVRIVTSHVTSGSALCYDYVLYASGNITPTGYTPASGTTLAGATVFPSVDTAVGGYYYNLAPVGQRISGNRTFTAGTYSGIWHIDGNVTIRSLVTINGTIISTRGISCSNRFNISINPTSNYPALVAEDAISFGNVLSLNMTGLVYGGSDGDGGVSITNSTGSFFGIIMAQGNINLSGSGFFTVNYDVSIKTNPPPGFSGGEAGAGVSNWKEI